MYCFFISNTIFPIFKASELSDVTTRDKRLAACTPKDSNTNAWILGKILTDCFETLVHLNRHRITRSDMIKGNVRNLVAQLDSDLCDLSVQLFLCHA